MSNGIVKIVAAFIGLAAVGGAGHIAKKKHDVSKYDEQIDKDFGIQTKKEYKNSNKKKK